MPSCHSCGADIPSRERVGRRDACAACGAELHCCANCRFHAPGRHNECAETQAEPVTEKARANFCDYFALRSGPVAAASPGAAARARLHDLFRKRTP